MNRPCRGGFTMVELLVAILAIGLLLALLVPGASQAWEVAQVTRCRGNLLALSRAARLWSADQQSSMFPTGEGWAGELVPYVETRADVFKCPSFHAVSTGGIVTRQEETRITQDQGSSGGGGNPAGEVPPPTTKPSDDTPPPSNAAISVSFDVYSDATFAKYLWTVGIDSPWCDKYPYGANEWRYLIEDQGYKGGGDNDRRDIDVAIAYKDGRPSQLTIIQGKPQHSYRFDLKINGKVVVHNMDEHRGEVVKFASSQDEKPPADAAASTSSTPSASGGSTGPWTQVTVTTFYYVPAEYGLSKGAYATLAMDAPKTDAKLIFLLDYPKALANYTGDNDQDDWDLYFFADPESWVGCRYLGRKADWRPYQVLRHGARANVVFCDGHMETLGPEDLVETSPLWRYGGR